MLSIETTDIRKPMRHKFAFHLIGLLSIATTHASLVGQVCFVFSSCFTVSWAATFEFTSNIIFVSKLAMKSIEEGPSLK